MIIEVGHKPAPLKVALKRRENLAKLAAFLRVLPTSSRFDMSVFNSKHNDFATTKHRCGSAACAVGWAPSAGIAPRSNLDWFEYAYRHLVDTESEAWEWMFSGAWSYADNTALGAAERIEWYLKNGTPPDYYEQREGDVPLCYRAETEA